MPSNGYPTIPATAQLASDESVASPAGPVTARSGDTAGDVNAIEAVPPDSKVRLALAKVLPAEEFEPRAREDQQDERNLFDRVKDMFG